MTVVTVTYRNGSVEEFRNPTRERIAEGVLQLGWIDKAVTIPIPVIRKIETYEES